MPRYLRPRRPGTPIFFTVTLAQRGSWGLIDHIGALREAVRVTRAERPLEIAAWVVLPDHLHCIWHLPEGDCDYSTRWGAIRARFSRQVRVRWDLYHQCQSPINGRVNPTLRASLIRKSEVGIWQRRFWGEERPEDGSVDRFQRRTRKASVAKPIIFAMNAITPRICGTVGSIG